jgi:hypothetical protein
MYARNSIFKVIAGIWMMLAAGCGSHSQPPTTTGPSANQGPAANLTIGGSTYGLLGSLVLDDNDGDALTLTADGKFTFSSALPSGTSYLVTVQTQPADQICTVSHGAGTLTNANVTTVTVNCSTVTRALGGTVVGLAASETVTLQNNGSDDLVVSANGGFTFSTPVAQGALYDVTVLTQPATQTCTVANGSGTEGSWDITNVQLTCATNAYTVGGAVSGLSGTLILQDNGADNLAVNGNGAYVFPSSVAQGAGFDVTVLTQPAGQTCTVTNGSGVMGGADVSNVGVSCVTNTTTLAASVSDLALSVTGLTEYGVPGTPSSGAARTITITNTGSYPAYNVAITQPTWPAGTAGSTTCGSTIAAGASCTVTITPGNTPTSDGTNPCSGGTAPVPGAIEVTADNATAVSSNVVILSYGCIYQGGYVYAFDDTTPSAGSVGGEVAATTDQAAPYPNGVIWSSNGTGAGTSSAVYDAIFGVSETSTASSPDPAPGQVTGQAACDGPIDGTCDSNNINVYYQTSAAGSPITPLDYAAGLCKQTIGGYSDWFLPAICELGYGNGGLCGTASAPARQNIQSNLVDSLNLLAGYYWSSTEYSAAPQNEAWFQYFAGGGGAVTGSTNKSSQLGVRCARSLTP